MREYTLKVTTITVSFNKRSMFLKRVWRVNGDFSLKKSSIVLLEESDV